MHRPLTHDDGMFASIPKAWLAGQGWGTHYDEFIPFNPDISTGPTLLLPVGALIAAFGNFYAAPTLAGVLSNLLLLSLILWRLQAYLPAHGWTWATTLVLTLTLTSPLGHVFGFSGYGTAWLLIMLGALILADTNLTARRRYLIVGVLLGLSIHAKLISLLAFGAMASTALLLEWRMQTRPWCDAARKIGHLLLGAATILLPWEMLKVLALRQESPEVLALRSAYGQRFFLYHGSGIGNLLDAQAPWKHLWGTAQRNAHTLYQFLETLLPTPAWLPLLAWCLSGPLALWRFHRHPDRLQALLVVLWLGSAAHISWYIVFAFTYHGDKSLFAVMPGLLLVLLTLISRLPLRLAAALTGALLLVTTLYHWDEWRPLLLIQPNPQDQAFRTAEEDTLAYLHTLPADTTLTGCGYSMVSRRMEYLWPEPGLFHDCYNLIEDSLDFDETAYQNRYPDVATAVASGRYRSGREHFHRQGWLENRQPDFFWRQPPTFHFVIDVPMAIFAGPHNPAALQVFEACKHQTLFDNRFFMIVHCTPETLQSLDINRFMRDVAKAHTWYRTRLRAL